MLGVGLTECMSSKPLHPIKGLGFVISVRQRPTPPEVLREDVLALGSQIRDTPGFSSAEKTLGHLVLPYQKGT